MDQQAPRRFGRYDVSILHDGFYEAPIDVLTHASGPAARERAIKAWGRPTLRIVVNCFLLRGPDGITLVDAGTGTSWGAAYGHARTALDAMGIARGDVDRVLITHLHGDHALGLFDGNEPYFPNAQVLVPEADLSFFTDEAKRDQTPENRRGGFAIAATLQRLYGGRVEAIAGLEDVLPGIRMIPLPGHTHGQSGYLIGDDAHSLLIWGDALHLETLQASDPDVGLVFDLDGATAVKTRRDILARASHEGWIVTGGHVEGFKTVRNVGNAFELVAA
ncbi:MBL fold metallo-hydrolase [Bosea sp. (in: a-proteobacteria)]|uniref:AidB family quorum-quenching N-acyl homoserine lactonase n=1 Tax=Bosea sp. (in: a-proteobacteria) TaxID=1871050 RepID=UPI003564189F